MMKFAILLSVCAAALALGADDPWAKLRALKSGTDLQVHKLGAAQPLSVQMGELTPESLVVINKNAEVAIPRVEIERVEARVSPKTRSMNDTKTTEKNAATDPRSTIPRPNTPPGAINSPTTEVSSGVTW